MFGVYQQGAMTKYTTTYRQPQQAGPSGGVLWRDVVSRWAAWCAGATLRHMDSLSLLLLCPIGGDDTTSLCLGTLGPPDKTKLPATVSAV